MGSRSVEAFDLSPYVPKETDLIISGGAKGIDCLAEDYADKQRISKLIMRPQYQLYGKAAPLRRNQVMADMADFVLVIWDGESKGTKFTIQYAQKTEKPLLVINLKEKSL